MRILTVLMIAGLGCTTQEPEHNPPLEEPATMTRPAEEGTDVDLSVEVNDNGGSVEASGDDGGTSVDIDAKLDLEAKKKKEQAQ